MCLVERFPNYEPKTIHCHDPQIPRWSAKPSKRHLIYYWQYTIVIVASCIGIIARRMTVLIGMVKSVSDSILVRAQFGMNEARC